jgi:hypothetical protein
LLIQAELDGKITRPQPVASVWFVVPLWFGQLSDVHQVLRPRLGKAWRGTGQ